MCEFDFSSFRVVHRAAGDQTSTTTPTCHARMLLSIGAPVTPDGGSFWSRLKSRINRLLAGVDILVCVRPPLCVCEPEPAAHV